MLTEVDISLLTGAGFTIAVCAVFRNWRATLWVIAIMASYAMSTIYWRFNLPHAEAVTALGDGSVVLLIYFFGRFQWEMILWRLFQISVAISILYLAGNLGVFTKLQHNAYAVMLEAVNWLAFLGLAGSSGLQRLRLRDGNPYRPRGFLSRAVLALRRERAQHSFVHRAR